VVERNNELERKPTFQPRNNLMYNTEPPKSSGICDGSLLCSKSHAPAFWHDCLSGSNLHQSQHSETLSQKTSTGPHHTRSLRFEVLKVSRFEWDRAQGALHCSRQASNPETDSMKTVI